MPTFVGPEGERIDVDELRFTMTGSLKLDGEFPLPKANVTGVYQGEVTDWQLKPKKGGGFIAVAKIRLTSGDLDVMPGPPNLFDTFEAFPVVEDAAQPGTTAEPGPTEEQ